MIDLDLLKAYSGVVKTYCKNQFIFFEGDEPLYYYQVVSGEIKMNNINNEGKEFVQGIFSKGRSFGEPPLFGDFLYPASAVSIGASEIIRLKKDFFFKLLEENQKNNFAFLKILSKRIHYKATMLSEIANQNALEKIISLIDFLKTNIYKIEGIYSYKVDLTRKQISELTGLRIETVIKSIKQLDQLEKIKIINHKIYR